MEGFSVRLSLRTLSLAGLEAIDWRRQHGMPDYSSVYTNSTTVSFTLTEEGFLRTWFLPTETNPLVTIDVDWLSANEVCLRHDRMVEIKCDLPESRVQRSSSGPSSPSWKPI